MPEHPLLAVAGPTGAGKSALALNLAKRFRGEILNFDSVQMYTGFDIGAAKLPVADQLGIPHHLIDCCDPSGLFTAGDFVALSRALIPQITARSRIPVLCGGTGFYLRALLRGLSASPGRDDALRERLLKREALRPGIIHRLLTRLDAGASKRIHPNDRNKSLRALELRILAGRPTGELFASAGLAPLTGYRSLVLGLDPAREELNLGLDRRCEEMWAGGLLDEVKALLAAGLSPSAKPFEALGYKQALLFVLGEASSERNALEEMKVRTRQYAKRQRTWFRAEKDIVWLEGFGTDEETQRTAARIVEDFIEKFEKSTEPFPR